MPWREFRGTWCEKVPGQVILYCFCSFCFASFVIRYSPRLRVVPVTARMPFVRDARVFVLEGPASHVCQ